MKMYKSLKMHNEYVIQDAIAALMPTIDDDKYDESIKRAFDVLLGLTPSSYMGIHAKQSGTSLPDDLREAFESYKGRLSDKSYQFRAFISSLHDLNPLDVNNISSEWQWLAKICHFWCILPPLTSTTIALRAYAEWQGFGIIPVMRNMSFGMCVIKNYKHQRWQKPTKTSPII